MCVELLFIHKSFFRDLVLRVKKLKKASRNVTSSLNRQIERAEAMKNVTETMALQNHRRETALGNYRKCVVCLSNYTEAGSIIVDEEEDEYSHLKDEPSLRRMSKFSLCLNCSKLSNTEAPAQNHSNLISVKEVPGGQIYFLKTPNYDGGNGGNRSAGGGGEGCATPWFVAVRAIAMLHYDYHRQ